MKFQWLFIGGPLDGATRWVGGAARVQVATLGGAYEYLGQNFLHRGRLYRIGVGVNQAPPSPSSVTQMIDDTGLQHIAGS